jgi:hypothetical protein
VRAGAVGRVVAPKSISTGRVGSGLQDTWQHIDARSTPCLDLKLVCGGTQSAGY